MHVHDDDLGFWLQLGQFAIGDAERIVVGGHEDTALQRENRVGRSLVRCATEKTAAGACHGEIGGTQEPRLARNEIQDLLAVPDMIAPGKYLDSGGQQFFGEPGGYAEPRRGILSIGDHQIRLLARDNVFQAFEYDSPAGRTYNVPNKQNAHGFNRWKERSASPCGARS